MEQADVLKTEKSRVEHQPCDVDVIKKDEPRSKQSKGANIVALIAMVIISVAMAVMLCWALNNEPVLQINNSPFPTRTIREHPTGGGVVFLDVDYCKNEDIHGDMRVSFVGSNREIFLPLTEENGKVGCHRLEVPVAIPANISAGEYKIKFMVTYNKNPLKQNEVIEFESQKIVIDSTAQ